MKLIHFKNNSTQRVYNDYIKRCRKALKGLPENDTEECLLEINSHIYEYHEANKTNDEMEILLNVLDRIGSEVGVGSEVGSGQGVRTRGQDKGSG